MTAIIARKLSGRRKGGEPERVCEVTGAFDGGNPQDENRIIRINDNSFLVFPFSEDEDPNYKFRVDLKVKNHSKTPCVISLTLDWKTEIYQEYRDYLFLRKPGEEEWCFVPGQIDCSRTHFSLQVEPGETYLCMHPKYNYADYLQFVESIEESGAIRKRLLGKSPEGRDVWVIEVSDPFHPASKNFVAVARVHPYETAGSFCAEGIVELFRDHASVATKLLQKFNFHIVPMASPDGVYNGYGKLPIAGGVDISKRMDESDPGARILKRLLDEVRPSIYIEFHNWMFKNVDGIYFLNFWQSHRFIRRMPSQEKFGKAWKPMLRRGFRRIEPNGLKKYCDERFGAICACFEYPWFRRDVRAMKELGARTLEVACEI